MIDAVWPPGLPPSQYLPLWSIRNCGWFAGTCARLSNSELGITTVFRKGGESRGNEARGGLTWIQPSEPRQWIIVEVGQGVSCSQLSSNTEQQNGIIAREGKSKELSQWGWEQHCLGWSYGKGSSAGYEHYRRATAGLGWWKWRFLAARSDELSSRWEKPSFRWLQHRLSRA